MMLPSSQRLLNCADVIHIILEYCDAWQWVICHFIKTFRKYANNHHRRASEICDIAIAHPGTIAWLAMRSTSWNVDPTITHHLLKAAARWQPTEAMTYQYISTLRQIRSYLGGGLGATAARVEFMRLATPLVTQNVSMLEYAVQLGLQCKCEMIDNAIKHNNIEVVKFLLNKGVGHS